MRQETYQNILRYSAAEWGTSRRQTDTYISRAKEFIREESAIARTNSFDEHLALRRNLYRRAYDDKNYRLCLDVLKDQSSLMDMYPAKPTKSDLIDSIQHLVDAKVVSQEKIAKITEAMNQFQQSALSAFDEQAE